ncbi:MAG TPA: TIGR04283 family arsenosugar biosynthesis glycosyltransferase [Gammaproteobacteria bacterium]
MQLSVIIPALNEGDNIRQTLAALQGLRSRGHEVIVVDGGSVDGSVQAANDGADNVLQSPPGRAGQMNAGAETARGDVLVFLHADSRLPENADSLIDWALAGEKSWGRFDATLSGSHLMFHVIAFFMNLRSRLTGTATGDQAIFVRRDCFHSIGGFPPIRLMEDIALCKTLRKIHYPARITARVVTSSRRWEVNGIFKTILLMWRLRLAYFFGADPDKLHNQYYRY